MQFSRIKLLKPIIASVVLIGTALVFIYYFSQNPETLQRLRDVPMSTLLLLLFLYGLFMASLVWIQRATLGLCNLDLGKKESTLLVMYSSIINFFGPLQSGPGFRAAYLKKRHDVNLKKYTAATLMYYGFYALFSGVLLLSFFIGWASLPLAVAFAFVTPFLLKHLKYRTFASVHIASLSFATLTQVMLMTIIYFVQLRSLSEEAAYLQTLIYTGAANFALFVSLTPGAIGFRESFLLFSQYAHGFESGIILTASLIDRSVYVTLLLILTLIIFGFHAEDTFKIQNDQKPKKSSKQ